MKIHFVFQRFIQQLENTPLSLSLWFTSFIALIIARIAIESSVGLFNSTSQEFFVYEFLHTFSFFLFSFILLWPIVAYFGNTSMQKASSVLLFGFLIILTPPLLDVWITDGGHLWSFYKFDSLYGLFIRYLQFFGDKPTIGITYGVRIEVALTIIFLSVYSYIKKKRFLHSLAAAITTYTILFILGTFPSWLTFIILAQEKDITSIKNFDIAAIFLSPPTLLSHTSYDVINGLNIKMSLLYLPLSVSVAIFLFWKLDASKVKALLNNARLPQIAFHIGLFFIGLLLARVFNQATFNIQLFSVLALINICCAITFAWLASVVVNDIFDTSIDSISNTHRPLQNNVFTASEYQAIGYVLFFFSLLFSLVVSIKAMFFILLYQALAWLYSSWVLRLKRFPLIATLFASLASLVIIFLGYTSISNDGSIRDFPLRVILYFLFCLTAFLPFKDLKDINGDKRDGVYTIPVIFGEQKGKVIIASLSFIVYLAGVFVFYLPQFIWIALFCGIASFLIIINSTKDTTRILNYRNLPHFLIFITSIYIAGLLWLV